MGERYVRKKGKRKGWQGDTKMQCTIRNKHQN